MLESQVKSGRLAGTRVCGVCIRTCTHPRVCVAYGVDKKRVGVVASQCVYQAGVWGKDAVLVDEAHTVYQYVWLVMFFL